MSVASAQTVHEEIQQLAKTAPLAMEFKGDARTWLREFRTKLDSSLGAYTPPTSTLFYIIKT